VAVARPTLKVVASARMPGTFSVVREQVGLHTVVEDGLDEATARSRRDELHHEQNPTAWGRLLGPDLYDD
jgi:hypothetical protein